MSDIADKIHDVMEYMLYAGKKNGSVTYNK
jgi:hypothetical protein